MVEKCSVADFHLAQGLEVVGITEVSALSHPDSTIDDERWECVDIKAVCDVPRPVTLVEIKQNEKLAEMALVKNTRLSVQPVREDEWIEVCRMAGLDGKTLKGL